VSARALALAVLAFTSSPSLALACSACRDPRDANQSAFLVGTIFLSLLPLGMFAAIALWFKKCAREAHTSTVAGPSTLPTPTSGPTPPSLGCALGVRDHEK
jgi:hypothetical protein